MSLWVKKTHHQFFSLLVSIPRNNPEFAKAAQAGGADAVKVHLNCKHPASGIVFGSFKDEQKNIEAVLKGMSLPVGVVPGAEITATVEELKILKASGIDFFDIYAHELPVEYFSLELGKMVCIDSRYSPHDLKQLASSGAEVFEASVIPHEGYGKPIEASDLIRWKELTENLSTPLLISTQRKIKPEECILLKEAGARGIVIGVVVTGLTVKGVEETTKKFRKAIDAIAIMN